MTRCKYCRAELEQDDGHHRGVVTGAAWCSSVHGCRDRMLDREHRVVRVFWRVYLNDTDRRTFHRLTGQDGAREFQEEQSAHTYVPALRRVTVRRKVKA